MSRMQISARNRLPGIVEEVVLGTVTAKISIRVGEHLIESVITKESAQEMKIQKGDRLTALIKSTEVIVLKE
jgi:molybdopterin-binding protein